MNWTDFIIAIKQGLIPSKKELVDGTTKVGNAEKLEGHGADHFLPKTGGRIENDSFTPLEINRTSNGANQLALPFKLNGNTLLSIGATKDGVLYIYDANNNPIAAILHEANYSHYALPKTGGTIEGKLYFKQVDNGYGELRKVNTADYDYGSYLTDRNASGEAVSLRAYANGNTAYFVDKTSTNKELLHTGNMASHVLPLNGGGVVSATNTVPLETSNTAVGATECYVGFKVGSSRVYIGMKDGKPRVSSVEGWGDVLHTGNSAKVHIGTSAPSDTSALWVDTSI